MAIFIDPGVIGGPASLSSSFGNRSRDPNGGVLDVTSFSRHRNVMLDPITSRSPNVEIREETTRSYLHSNVPGQIKGTCELAD